MQTEEVTRNDVALAGLRLLLGAIFVIFGQYKVLGTGFTRGGGFQFWINGFLPDRAYPFMVPVLKAFVLPHATAMAFLVAYGELAIGIALIVGVLIRAASTFGLIYMLLLLFSANYPVASDYPGGQSAFWEYFGAASDHLFAVLCFATLTIGRSDRVLTLSRMIKRSLSER
ncbi:MAG TPA: DoxX family protein [Steroidobacteraceae bacterium]|jgi:thiosulfate dehydrogenase [quinone] large subunit